MTDLRIRIIDRLAYLADVVLICTYDALKWAGERRR